MVKNTHGGNKHKSQGRKFVNAKSSNKLRVAENEGELYSIVIKMCGNGMCHTYCIDGVVRLCHIRGKFSGRGKRDNFVEVGKWVLVGEREWDIGSSADKTKTEKLLKCDLLEVYNDLDKERLQDTISMDWNILSSQDVTKKRDVGDALGDEITFQTQREEECNKLLSEINQTVTKAIELKEDNEEIVWDDI